MALDPSPVFCVDPSPVMAFARSGRLRRSRVLLDSPRLAQGKSRLETRRKGHKGHGGKAQRGGLTCHAGGGGSVHRSRLVKGGEELLSVPPLA